jgi:hypothetical protein
MGKENFDFQYRESLLGTCRRYCEFTEQEITTLRNFLKDRDFQERIEEALKSSDPETVLKRDIKKIIDIQIESSGKKSRKPLK